MSIAAQLGVFVGSLVLVAAAFFATSAVFWTIKTHSSTEVAAAIVSFLLLILGSTVIFFSRHSVDETHAQLEMTSPYRLK